MAPQSDQQTEKSKLADFVTRVAGEGALRVEETLGEGYVRLRITEAERRQAAQDIRCIEDAVIELLRNSRDAGADRILVATNREGDLRSLVVLDNGQGIPESLHESVFEARVTSKLDSMHMDKWGVHGRGMALYSTRENARSAKIMASAPELGCSIRIVSDTEKLTERADQSTWPTLSDTADGLRGPHNIIRTCCDFVLESEGQSDVWVGSPAEIAATARAITDTHGVQMLISGEADMEALPVITRIAAAGDAQELKAVCDSLGLNMSERTAHRILAGEIKPVPSVSAKLKEQAKGKAQVEVDILRNPRGLRISQEDIRGFTKLMEKDFEYLAQRYYLALSSSPTISVRGDRIQVSFDIDKGD